ncbi:MAG: endonuclease domain-containing protein [Candidatus Omnitrophica bacterium]|nr:endonuclease domain-containing protein [Candidatus Omnitrophota bacterium]
MNVIVVSPPLVGGVRGGGKLKKALTLRAKELRNNSTEAEKYLWYVLRLENLGVKFRRQTVIGRYIVDFVCFERKLVVELDGGQHAQSQHDHVRDQWLKGQGFEVLRFWNHDVLGNREEVLQKIVDCLTPPPLPSPQGGGNTCYQNPQGDGIQ